MAHARWSTPRARLVFSAALSLGGHAALFGLLALIVVNYRVTPPEFVELNIGRVSQQQMLRMIYEAQHADALSEPGERARTPTQRLPRIDVPTIRPDEVERRLLPERIAVRDEKPVPPPRAPAMAPPPSPSMGDRKVLYEGTRQVEVGPRPGEGITSEHVGSDIHPVFLIEGELQGRHFHEAALTTVPDVPARTQVQLDVVVAPSGSVISVLVARKENARLETFAVNYIRRCRFDPLPGDMPQENQSGRITVTFTPRVD